MSTVHERLNKEYLKLPGVCDYVQFTKGAPGEVLNLCTHYLDENSVIKPLTDDKRELIQSHIRRMANNALRYLPALNANTKNRLRTSARKHWNMI